MSTSAEAEDSSQLLLTAAGHCSECGEEVQLSRNAALGVDGLESHSIRLVLDEVGDDISAQPAKEDLIATLKAADSPSADVVLVTVNDVETACMREALERAGYIGSFRSGRVNSYYLYGPIRGAVVAHVRSGMGSTGQSG
jgi:hypothetical protein